MGNWINDRDRRKQNEQKWGSVGVDPTGHREARPVDPRKTGEGKHDRKVSDLDRAIEAEMSKQPKGLGSGLTPKDAGFQPYEREREPWTYQPTGGMGAGNGPSTLGDGFKGLGTRVERPTIAGGCSHDAKVPAITLEGGRRLYGAQGAKIVDASHLDLIIDLAGLVKAPKAFVQATGNGAGKYRKLNALVWPDVVRLDWPDMTAPSKVGIKFWQELHRMLPRHTAVACMGGHGRTGTALAALLVADGMGGQEAIDRVRREHCVRAIETKEQEDYIRGLAKAMGNGNGQKRGR